MFFFYCFWTLFCEPAPFELENITYGLNQKVLITETNIETELPCIEINQQFEFKYFRKCTYKTTKILIAALIHLLKLARKIIGLIFDSVWNVTFELKFSRRNYYNTVSFQVSIGSLNVKVFKPSWPNYRGLYLGWGAGKFSGVFGQIPQYSLEHMNRFCSF